MAIWGSSLVPLRCSKWIFFLLFLISVHALPEKLSTGFATSVLNLMSFCIQWARGDALWRSDLSEAGFMLLLFLSPGSCTYWTVWGSVDH